MGGVLARTLWDTGCSHDIITPEFAEELLRKGARWRECAPLVLAHGNADHVTAAAPPTRQVCASVMLVHQAKIFRAADVWLYVYDGCFPDVMLSEGFLNSIPCLSRPGDKLLDTFTTQNDRQLLALAMQDYQGLIVRRFLCPEIATSDLHLMKLNVALEHLRTGVEGGAGDGTATAVNSGAGDGTAAAAKDRVQELKKEMEAQRVRLCHRLGKPVSPEALQAASAILDRFPENFRPPGRDPCKLAVFKLKLKDNTKFHIALPRRCNPIVMADMRRQIEELLEVGAIERCRTNPSSVYAVVMAKKPGSPDKRRLCIDLIALNANTEPMPYPMPSVHEALDRLSGKKYYSSFDFSAWFQQFEIAAEDREKVAFVIPGDNISPPQMYQWKRMCFGLLDAGYWSQRQLQEALEQFKGCTGIYPFVDDIVIASDTLEEHLEKLEAFMRFCQFHNIRIKREKVELVTGAVKHLGCILSEEGQMLDPARIESLLAIGAPANLKGLKSLLGSFSFIRGWLAGMADVAAPLTDLMGAAARRLGFRWGPEQEAALEALKMMCQIAPALGAPDYTKTFHVSMDASDVGVGAVLWQYHTNAEGKEIPRAIIYASRRFSDRERRWAISLREMYSIKYALEKFRAYLQGCPDVILHSDHLNLVTGMYSHASPMIERWRLFIESCRPFRIQHVRGTDDTQAVADGLSRLHVANLALGKCPDEFDAEARLQAELGEGGRDENMFETHVGTVANVWERVVGGDGRRALPARTAAKKSAEADRSKVCTVNTAWASIVNNTRAAAAEEELRRAQVYTPEEAKRQQRYGVGCDLLKKMGWSLNQESHRRMGWEKQAETNKSITFQAGPKGRHGHLGGPGLGLGRCNTTSVVDPLDDDGIAAPEHFNLDYLGTVNATKKFWVDGEDMDGLPAAGRATTKTMTTTPPDRTKPTRPPRRAKTTIDATTCGAANLICALPDLQEHGNGVEITCKRMRGRRPRTTATTQKAADLRVEVGVRESRHALGAMCNAAHVAETQTEVDAFREAGKRWRGEFPSEQLLKRCHDETHPSFAVTWRRVIRATGIGPGLEQSKLKKEVRHYCDACPTCQKLQPARERVQARQGTIRKRPFAELAFDTIVLNTPDVDGNNHVLVVIDSFSHAVELFPLKRATADAVTTCLHDVLCRWGKPHQVRHDNAKAFAAHVTRELFRRARVKQHFTAPYSHNSNGQVENTNRRVMSILRAMILDDRLGPQTHLQWGLLLPAVRRVIMTRMVLQHGCCPNDLAYAFSPENEDSIFAEEVWMPGMKEAPVDKDASTKVAELLRQHQVLIEACEEKQDELLSKLATLHDMRAQDMSPLQPGEFVLVDMRERPHTKVMSPWSGPWQVVEEKEDNEAAHPMLVLQHIATKKIDRFHSSMCKRCNMDLFQELEAAIPYAARDNFEYEIEVILDHEPKGERKRRRKDTYQFQVLWRGIDRSEDNPSWEPWANESLRASEPFLQYCQRADVRADLGSDFVAEPGAGSSKKSKAAKQTE